MSSTEKNNLRNLLATLTSAMLFDRNKLESMHNDLCRMVQVSSCKAELSAMITLAQGTLGGYGWSEADMDRAEDCLEAAGLQ